MQPHEPHEQQQRSKVALVVPLAPPKAAPEDGAPGSVMAAEAASTAATAALARQRFFQVVDARLRTEVWAFDWAGASSARAGPESRATQVDGCVKLRDDSLCPLTRKAREAEVVRVCADGVVVAALDDCSLVACETSRTDTYGSLSAREGERFDCRVELPYRANDVDCSSDSRLVIAVFGTNNRDDPSLAALILGIGRAKRFGEEDESKLELSAIRKLSDTYVTSVPGSLRFSQVDPRQILFAWAGAPDAPIARRRAAPSKRGNYALEIQVGAVKLSRSEVVQHVDASTMVRGAASIRAAQWNATEDALVLVADKRELFLFRRAAHTEARWQDTRLDVDIDFVRWHPSSLVLAVASTASAGVLLLDAALQPLQSLEFQLPALSAQAAPTHAARLVHWMHSVHDAEAAVAQDKAASQVVGLDPLAIVVFAQDGTGTSAARLGSAVHANWRSLLRVHLRGDKQRGLDILGLERAAAFAMSLRGRPDDFGRASRLVVREAHKFADGEVPVRVRDVALHLTRVLLAAMRTAALAQRGPQELDLVQSCERRYVAGRLRLGHVELACQFAFQLAESHPDSAFVAGLFDQVVVWGTTFGQGDTVAPLARSAAERLRAFQREQRKILEGQGKRAANWAEPSPAYHQGAASRPAPPGGSEAGSAFGDAEASPPTSAPVSPRSIAAGPRVPHSDLGSSSASSGSESQEEESFEKRGSQRSPGGSDSGASSSTDASLGASPGMTAGSGSGSRVGSTEGSTAASEDQREVPDWDGGRGGSVLAEELGAMLEELEQSSSKRLWRDMDKLWHKWRKLAAARAASVDEGHVSLESASPSSLSSAASGGGRRSSERDLFSSADALRLGAWLECRGKLTQASEVYQVHGLQREARRLKLVERALDPARLDLIPDLSFVAIAAKRANAPAQH